MLTARRTLLATLLLLVAAGLAAALLLKHYGVGTPADALCGVAEGGCDVVNTSAYSQIAGLPLAAIGLVFYLSLAGSLVLALLAGDAVRLAIAKLAAVALGASLLVDLGLLAVQAFELKAYCVLCLLTYAMGASAFGALFGALRADASQVLAPGEGRLVVGGWLIGSLAATAAVATYHVALSARPASPTALLGGGANAGGAEVERLREQLKQLQETIDDPQKLEQYFSRKAQRDFEQAAVQNLDLAGVPFKGPAAAPIKVVEYSDFLCPFCRSLAEGFAGLLPQTAGRVSVYYKNYPLDTACNGNISQTVHEGACWLALGGLCAAEQNRFWPYHDRVFSREQKPTSREEMLRIAAEAGLDTGALASCVAEPATLDKLKAQIHEGSAAGVKGTPTVFINGKRVVRLNDFIALVDKESARLGLPPLPRPEPPQAQPAPPARR